MNNIVDIAQEGDLNEEMNLDPQDFENTEEVIESNDEPQMSPTEQKARELGWKPLEEFQGHPDDWATPGMFLKTRELVETNKSLRSEVDSMKHDFSKRIDGLQKFHEASLEAQRQALIAKRDQAASEADMDAYKQANDQLDALDAKDQPQQTQQLPTDQLMKQVVSHPVTQQFISENPWIREQSAKGVYGQKVFADWLESNINNPNAVLEDGLKFVKDSVNKEFPQMNPNRNTNMQMGDRGNGPRRIQTKNTLTMNDLTAEERGIWNSMGDSWEDQADFLQAVADSRKGG